jgi:hypothetical protein
MSMVGSDAATVAAETVPSPNVTRMRPAPLTTCSAVRMVPSALTTTPVPVSSVCPPGGGSASMNTTEGATES